MGTLSPISALKEADLQIPEGQATGATIREAFRRLFSQLNPYFDGVNKLAAKGVTLGDNLKCDVVTGKFSHGVAQQVSLKTLPKAGGAVVLSAEGQIAIGTPSVQMVQIAPTAQYGPLARVTVFFGDPAAANVNCTLLLLPEGSQTTAVPIGFAPPRGRAYLTIATSLPSGASTVINYDTKDEDSAGAITTGAAWKYTCKVPGLYAVSATAGVTGISALAGSIFPGIYVNGTEKERGTRQSCPVGQSMTLPVVGQVRLAVGDFLQIKLFHNSGATEGTETAAQVNHFECVMVSA